MNFPAFKRYAHVLSALCLCLGAPAHAQDRGPTIASEVFLSNAAFTGAAMSPDGRHVAIRKAAQHGRSMLAVVDVATLKAQVLANYANADVGFFFWLNDKRIAFSLVNELIKGDANPPGVYAIDIDRSNLVPLSDIVEKHRSFADPDNLDAGKLDGMLADGQANSDELFITIVFDEDTKSIKRLNSRTRKLRPFLDAREMSNVKHWLLDEDGRIALTAETVNGNTSFFDHTRRFGSNNLIASFGTDSDERMSAQHYSKQFLYVLARKGSDYDELYRYDLEKRVLDANALIGAPGFDVDGSFITAQGKALGYRFQADAEAVVWFDPTMKSIQQEVDALFPATVNRISRGMRSETPFVLIDSYSDRQPHTFVLFDRDSKKLIKLGDMMPGVDAKRMAGMEMKSYPARDGLKVPVYLTMPVGEKKAKLPTIVLVNSRPWSRALNWQWDPIVQLLAARGYAVIQPQTRGSDGFGLKHYKAGLKQWGLAMQDDLADAAKWAIAQGIADPKRICIAGTYYGGYAALMGVINNPDLFQCAISWAGITDIEKMFDIDWKDGASSSKYMRGVVGDPAKDKVQLRATSPLSQAARLTRPVLLAYGENDVQVPKEQGVAMYKAIKEKSPASEFYLFDQKGQEWSTQQNRIEFWAKAQQFLEREIGKP
ncbi:MAG: prolyl oligopeptidase family serine peptidase [Pseudomonadota bacterium]